MTSRAHPPRTPGHAATPPIDGDEPRLADVARAWDGNAASRRLELQSNSDPAYRAIVHHFATTIRRHKGAEPLRVLDAGCGVGALSGYLQRLDHDVTGVDCSGRSIAEAATAHPECRFIATSLEDFAGHATGPFDVVVVNMVLHCTPDLPGFLSAAHVLLAHDGLLVALIPHPAFYLAARGDAPAHLANTVCLARPFSIRGRAPHPYPVWYFHRPISTYINALTETGFGSIRAEEPYQIGPGRSYDTFSFTAAPTQ